MTKILAPVLLHIDFVFNGPWGDALAEACEPLAKDIAGEPGLLWKVWTEDQSNKRAGGEYLFDNHADAQRYLDKHRDRLQAMGVMHINIMIFDVNVPLSRITRVPFGA